MPQYEAVRTVDLPLDEDDVRAAKAIARGEASESQQQLFLKLVLDKLCGVDDDCFVGDERETSFALGRRNPGLRLRRMILLPVEATVPRPRRARLQSTN